MNFFPLVIVALVLIATSLRSLFPRRMEIWLIMCLGAAAVMLTGSISLKEAIYSINPDVMLFLFFMFILGSVLSKSGFLYVLEYKLFRGAESADKLLLYIIFSMALLSYFFMNDTIAIIATPLMIFLSKKHSINHKILLLALAFSITIGSVPSPIGNPQNLLIAVKSGIDEPFSVFAGYLLVPSVINLFAVYFVIKIIFRNDLKEVGILKHEKSDIEDCDSYKKAKVSVFILIASLVCWVILKFAFIGIEMPIYAIPVLPALFGLASSKRKTEIVKSIDYKTLLFFAGMFVLMKSLYIKQEPQILFDAAKKAGDVPFTMAISIFVSQIVSNVPFAALFVDSLKSNATNEIFTALAAGSTIAGNLFILGAASNVIIIQKAEREGKTLSFIEFSKCGIILTAVNFLVYWVYFSLI